jgi:hypothetical protein
MIIIVTYDQMNNIICSKIYTIQNSNNELKWMVSHNHTKRGDNDIIWGVKIYIII